MMYAHLVCKVITTLNPRAKARVEMYIITYIYSRR